MAFKDNRSPHMLRAMTRASFDNSIVVQESETSGWMDSEWVRSKVNRLGEKMIDKHQQPAYRAFHHGQVLTTKGSITVRQVAHSITDIFPP